MFGKFVLDFSIDFFRFDLLIERVEVESFLMSQSSHTAYKKNCEMNQTSYKLHIIDCAWYNFPHNPPTKTIIVPYCWGKIGALEQFYSQNARRKIKINRLFLKQINVSKLFFIILCFVNSNFEIFQSSLHVKFP